MCVLTQVKERIRERNIMQLFIYISQIYDCTIIIYIQKSIKMIIIMNKPVDMKGFGSILPETLVVKIVLFCSIFSLTIF